MINRSLSVYLIDLIKGLTKAEKKHFQLYAKRNTKERELKFLHLFNFIDKTNNINDELIRKKFPELSTGQISELKAYLYEQILICLRLLKRKDMELSIREQIDWAYILYSKGLYKQSLSMFSKARKMAQQFNKDVLQFEILEAEKIIESRYITQSYGGRVEDLASEASIVLNAIVGQGAWSNFVVKLAKLSSKYGLVKDEMECQEVKKIFDIGKPGYTEDQLSFFGKISLFQSYACYHFICHDFENSCLYILKWVDLFEKEPVFKKLEMELYIKGLSTLVVTLMHLKKHDEFVKYSNQLKDFVLENEQSFGINLKLRAFHFVDGAEFNLFYMEGRFDDGVKYLPEFIKRFESHHRLIDRPLLLMFNFRIAYMYFGAGEFKNAVKYLNDNVNLPADSVREDLQAFSRILLLMSHFELANNDLLEYQLKSVSRFLINSKENQQVQTLILDFLKVHLYSEKEQLRNEFIELRDDLNSILNIPFERRALIYIDFESWIESKIQDIPMKQIVRKKFLMSQKKNEMNAADFDTSTF